MKNNIDFYNDIMHYNYMTTLNLQVRIDSKNIKEIDILSSKSRSEFVRQAIIEKIEKEQTKKLEEQWIQALSKHPDTDKNLDHWLAAEAWEEK